MRWIWLLKIVMSMVLIFIWIVPLDLNQIITITLIIQKRDEISENRYLRKNNGSPDGVDSDDMLPESARNQYWSIEYNNVY